MLGSSNLSWLYKYETSPPHCDGKHIKENNTNTPDKGICFNTFIKLEAWTENSTLILTS